jgi:spore coat protein U-like protein
VKSCDFNPIPAASLGTYNWHAGLDTTVEGGLSVECNAGVVYSFSSDHGINADGTQNYLASGAYKLGYSLLVDDGNGHPYDPATNVGPGAIDEVASGRVDRYALVLDVPTSQMVPAGAYADTVSFSLNY